MGYEMWAWLVEEEDGSEGVIAAMIPGTGILAALHHRRHELAERLGDTARAHGKAMGRPVRLAHLVEAD